MDGNLPSGLTFAYAVLYKIHLSPLAYSIVSVHKSVTYVTDKVLTSRHDCVLDRHTCDLEMRKRLAILNCVQNTAQCILKTNLVPTYSTKESRRIFWENQCHCKLCVKRDLQI
jgi:hypothetical protein